MPAKANRPSPSKSATAFKAGHRMAGNDGATYEVVVAANGVKRWRKVKDAGVLKRARLIITPSLQPTKDDAKDIAAATYLRGGPGRYQDLVGPRALKVVRHALSWVKGSAIDGDHGEVAVRQVVTVAFDMAKLQYVVDVTYEGTPKDLKAMANDILFVGYAGADTWMEGDIRVNDDHELYLKLARLDAAP